MLAGLSLCWAGFTGFALFLLAAPLHQSEAAVVVTCLLCGTLLLPITLGMLALCLRSLTRPLLLELTETSLTDHRISPGPMPWADLRWIAAGPQALMVAPGQPPLRAFWPYRLLARLYRWYGLPEWPILPLGTGHSTTELAALFRRFRKPG